MSYFNCGILNSIVAMGHKSKTSVLSLSIETCIERAEANIDVKIEANEGVFSIQRIQDASLRPDKNHQCFVEGRLRQQLIATGSVFLQEQSEGLTKIIYEVDVVPSLIKRFLIMVLGFLLLSPIILIVFGIPGILCFAQFLFIILLIACATFWRMISLRDTMLNSLMNTLSKPSSNLKVV